MANIVVSMFNFLLKPDKLDACPPFYEGFIKGLKNAGNNVLCFQLDKIKLGRQGEIPPQYLNKIIDFKPDLFIFFNNQFWDIADNFPDVPIVIYDVDSPIAYYNIDKIRENPDRYKFITIQTSGKTIIEESIKCSSKNIEYVPLFASVEPEDIEQDINISFCGTNWFWKDFDNVIKFMNSNPNKHDIDAAKEVFNLFKKYPTLTSDEIYSQFEIEADKKLYFNNLFYYACRISGLKRLRVLSEVADLGLEVCGLYWFLKDPTLAAFPELLFSCSKDSVNSIETTQKFFNRSKISINTKHIQAKDGFSWRVCDILASNACLVTERADDLTKLGFKLPMFESPAEARDICKLLLENENLRKDIVAHSQEIIDKNHRFKSILPVMENFIGIKLQNYEIDGALEIVPVFNNKELIKAEGKKELMPVDFNKFPKLDDKRMTFKNKMYYKIARHFYKRVYY